MKIEGCCFHFAGLNWRDSKTEDNSGIQNDTRYKTILMSSLLPLRRCLRSLVATRQQQQRQQQQQQQPLLLQFSQYRYMGHSVRIIAIENLPNNKCYQGEVTNVKAGYARNYLIPQKMAVYATQKNFMKLGVTDPNIDAQLELLLGDSGEAGRSAVTSSKKAVEKGSQEEQDLKAAELLKHYLRNKVLKIWRNVQTPSQGSGGDVTQLYPGMVDARAVRQKLSKQLRIDLEPHEKVYLLAQPLGTLMAANTAQTTTTTTSSTGTTTANDDDDNKDATSTTTTASSTKAPLSEEEEIQALVQKAIPPIQDGKQPACNVQIRQLGDYLAGISLRGGHVIPLKVAILKR